MAAPKPTEAEIQTQIANVVEYFYQILQFGNVTAGDNIVTMQDVIIQSMEGLLSGSVLSALQASRASIAGTISPSRMRAVLDPLFLTYASVRNLNARTPEEALDQLYDDFVTNTKTVLSRQFGWDLSAAGGGGDIGNGGILAVSVNEDNEEYESSLTAENVIAECVADRNTGANINEEIWEFRGEANPLDPFDIDGNGNGDQTQRMTGVSARTSGIIQNPSFSGTTAASPALLVTNWVIDSWQANLDVSTTIYRSFVGEGTAQSLNATGNFKLSQVIEDGSGRNYNPNVPYYTHVAFQRQASCDGILNLRLGSQSTTFDVATTSNNLWAVLRLGISNINWPKVFTENGLDIEIELTGNTTGNVLIDDTVQAPFVRRSSGIWYAPLSHTTPPILGDTFTFNHTVTEGAKIQLVIARAYRGRFFPHTTGAPSWTEPT